MHIELTEEDVDYIKKVMRLPHHDELSVSFIVSRALMRYYERKKDDLDYARYRASAIRKRLSHQSYLCYFCQEPLAIGDATIDHLTPRSRGGGAVDPSNIVVACARCNGEKDSMTEEEYKTYKEKYGHTQPRKVPDALEIEG